MYYNQTTQRVLVLVDDEDFTHASNCADDLQALAEYEATRRDKAAYDAQLETEWQAAINNKQTGRGRMGYADVDFLMGYTRDTEEGATT